MSAWPAVAMVGVPVILQKKVDASCYKLLQKKATQFAD